MEGCWLISLLVTCLVGMSHQQSGGSYGNSHRGPHNSGYGGGTGGQVVGYGYGQQSYAPRTYGYQTQSYGHNNNNNNQHNSGSGYGYEQKHSGYGTECYQCSYSPDKTYYKTIKNYVEYPSYGYGGNNGHNGGGGYGQPKGYYDEKVVPVTVRGGWDKCRGPFSHYQAKHWGIDTWKCYSKCYTRKDYNGDIVRGCYKGEYGIDPYRGGCQKAGGSEYCFCEGDKCNNKAVGYNSYH